MIHRSRQSLNRAEADPQADQRLAVTLARTIWDNVPLLLVIDAALAMAAFPVLLAAGFGAVYFAPLLAALLLGPIWLAAMHVAGKLLDGDGVSIGAFFRAIREYGTAGIHVAIVPGVLMSVMLATLDLFGRNEGQNWMLLPVAVDGMLAMTAIVLFFPASLLTVSNGLSGRNLWRQAAFLAGVSPMATLGMIAGLATVWIVTQFVGPLAIVLLAAPVSLFTVAVFRWSAVSHGIGRES